MNHKKQYWHLCQLVASWCMQNLLNNPAALEYVKQRSITLNSVSKFTIGYFPGGLQAVKALIEHAKKHNYLVQDLLEASILIEGKAVLYSPFEERIIFPINDTMGRTCGFGGRIFKPNDMRPKYYNSKENTHFSKGSLFFGLDLAKKKIQETETVFLVEGYTDCVAMTQAGVLNTVATLGTACTIEHLKQLTRLAKTLIVTYDGDQAGQQAMLRLTEDLELNNYVF